MTLQDEDAECIGCQAYVTREEKCLPGLCSKEANSERAVPAVEITPFLALLEMTSLLHRFLNQNMMLYWRGQTWNAVKNVLQVEESDSAPQAYPSSMTLTPHL